MLRAIQISQGRDERPATALDWLEWVDWMAPLLAEPLQIVDGMALVSEWPGAGLAWDPEMVGRYAQG